MAVGLVRAVDSVKETLVSHIPELNAARCVYGDLDALVEAMVPLPTDDDTRYGCLLQFANIEHGPAEPFSQDIWQYYLSGILMIRLKSVDDIESEMLAITDTLRTTFSSKPRGLAGDLALVRILNIERPITSTIVDTPHYFLPFMIRIYDK